MVIDAMRQFGDRHIKKTISIAPLITFRVLFGFMMVVSIVRFAAMGWIDQLYVEPTYYFTYYGFDWIQPLNQVGMYIVFLLMAISAIGICIGLFYRISAASFFITFTYVELIDKTNYLNHYYFVSLIAFLLIWGPAHRHFSLDVAWRRIDRRLVVPAWCINVFKWQLSIVYIYAGVAKLNPHWLLEALPMRLWLPAKSHLPVIGPLLELDWIPYAFSWAGAGYDLFIVFFLYYHRTRPFAYLTVIVFHLLTAMLFQIGMFPYIMIMATLIFFSAAWHERLQDYFVGLFNSNKVYDRITTSVHVGRVGAIKTGLIVCFFAIQLLMPWRFLMYEGPLFWTEQGYRFSWRVMLMEKAGYATFRVVDSDGKAEYVTNYEHLKPQQEKMMSTQPDMILQYAHYLRDFYMSKGWSAPEVYCDSRVTLNKRRSQPLVNSTIDLAKESRGWKAKTWILPWDKNKI